MTGLRGAWPTTRAALLTIVLVVEGVTALPIPHTVRKRDLALEPVAVEEIETQRALLAKVGIQLSHAEIVDGLAASGEAWAGLYSRATKPLGPVFRVLGIGQSWGLFTYPDTFPHQLTVEIRTAKTGPWALWYAGLDAEHPWMAEVLTYRRVRGVYDGQTTKPGASWNNITRWLAARACATNADVEVVRVSFRRFHTVRPDQTADDTTDYPSEQRLHARVWARAQVTE